METIKIRHILPAEGLRAIYATIHGPDYFRDIPCVERALVTRKAMDEEGNEYVFDDTVGRILSGRIVDADLASDSSMSFVCYVNDETYDRQQYGRIVASAAQIGYARAMEGQSNVSNPLNLGSQESDE